MGMCKTEFRPPLNFSASATHAHFILGSSRKIHIDREDVHLQFAELQIILRDSQNARILEYARRSTASKALPLENLSGAVSAYYQRQAEPVVLDTIKKCGDH